MTDTSNPPVKKPPTPTETDNSPPPKKSNTPSEPNNAPPNPNPPPSPPPPRRLPPSSVSLRNLQTTTALLPDAWNRPHKLQPLLLSASVWFQHPFPTTSAADALSTTDTVHYGNLAKALLAALPSTSPEERGMWIGGLVCDILFPGLTGETLSGTGEGGKLVDLRGGGIRYLSLTARLPKASLLGSGVSFTLSVAPGGGKYATALAVEGVRVPVLVGVNENERGARQVVEVTVTVEGVVGVGGKGGDWFARLEGVVVDAMEKSSFETLEALGACIADRVLFAFHPSNQEGPDVVDGSGWQIHVRMEKPTAVPLADCPIVEIRTSAEARK